MCMDTFSKIGPETAYNHHVGRRFKGGNGNG